MLLLDDFLETRATGRRNVAHTKISITFRVRLDHKSSSLSLSLSLFGCCLASKYPVARLSASISPRCRALFYVLHKSSSAHSLDRCNGGCSLLDARVITRRICFARWTQESRKLRWIALHLSAFFSCRSVRDIDHEVSISNVTFRLWIGRNFRLVRRSNFISTYASSTWVLGHTFSFVVSISNGGGRTCDSKRNCSIRHRGKYKINTGQREFQCPVFQFSQLCPSFLTETYKLSTTFIPMINILKIHALRAT